MSCSVHSSLSFSLFSRYPTPIGLYLCPFSVLFNHVMIPLNGFVFVIKHAPLLESGAAFLLLVLDELNVGLGDLATVHLHQPVTHVIAHITLDRNLLGTGR